MTTERKKPEITTAIILEKRKKNKDEKHPVKLRIYDQYKRRYYTIKGHYYDEAEFEKIMASNSKGTKKDRKLKLLAVENRAIDIIDNVLDKFTFEDFDREYKTHKRKQTTIQSYFEAKAEMLESQNKFQTATIYRATLNSLEGFDSKITFNKITPAYLKRFEEHMVKQEKSFTTIAIYLRHFKHIINLAIRDKVMTDYPFGTSKDKYQIPTARNVKKALTLADIETLFKYKSDSGNENQAVQYFLFSYLCNGMNFVDIANLKFKNIKDNNIQFIRQKTKDTSKEKSYIRIIMLPQVKQIIQKIGNKEADPDNYIFPIYEPDFSEAEKLNKLKQHIKNTNKYLKRVAEKVGIHENITTYFARHTYSTVLKRSGTPIEFIAEQLGHKSTRVTQSYLDSFEDEQRLKYSQNTLPESMRDSESAES